MGVISAEPPITKFALKTLSHDLHAFADEATDHLKDAARTTGSEAAVARPTKAIMRAADRVRDEAETSAVNARKQASATVRDHPAAADIMTRFVTSTLVALAATFALVCLSQS